MTQTERQPPKLVRKLQDQRETHKHRHPAIRVAFALAGLTLIAAGAAMVVLPGPAFVVIPIGLAMLSLEFGWAGRLLDKSLVKADEAKDKAAGASKTSKLLSGAAIALAAAAAIVVALAYDVPYLPV